MHEACRNLKGILVSILFLSNTLSLAAHTATRKTTAEAHATSAAHSPKTAPTTPTTNAPAPSSDARASAAASYGKLPLRFEANKGQTDARVKFIARGLGYGLFLTPAESVLVLRGGAGRDGQAVVRMKLAGANPSPSVEGAGELPGVSNYFVGKDPSRWRTDARSFSSVRYRDVYPGVDLVYHGDQRQLEYDYVLAPGASARSILVSFEGARASVERSGDLVLRTRGGAEVRQRKPFAYQEVGGERREVAARFARRGGNSFGFDGGAYDPPLPLLIAPTVSLAYGAFVGGDGVDTARDMVLDASGNAWLVGVTTSSNFPATAGAPQPSRGDTVGFGDAFVAKLSAAGDARLYATYIGGAESDDAYGVALDSAGNVYVTGYQTSPHFPTTAGAYQTSPRGRQDAFVLKLNPSASGASALAYSTLLGGGYADFGEDIAVDDAGRVHVVGDTNSANFPTRNAFDPTYNGLFDGHLNDVFVAKLNPAGAGNADLLYSTFMGGSPQDFGLAVTLDNAGNTYVTGATSSNDFPVTPGAFQNVRGDATQGVGSDAFVSKMNLAASGATSLVYSTFVGGN